MITWYFLLANRRETEGSARKEKRTTQRNNRNGAPAAGETHEPETDSAQERVVGTANRECVRQRPTGREQPGPQLGLGDGSGRWHYHPVLSPNGHLQRPLPTKCGVWRPGPRPHVPPSRGPLTRRLTHRAEHRRCLLYTDPVRGRSWLRELVPGVVFMWHI